MAELLLIPIFPVILTLLAYRLGVAIQQKAKSPLCNPILLAVIFVLLFLRLANFELKTYQAGTSLMSWLMTPATVCLAISMYEQFQILRKNIGMVLAGVAAGAISCLMMVLGLCLLFRFDPELTASLLPKSVTTAIGVPLTQMIGGLGSVTTAAIILSGIIASILGPTLCKLFRLTNKVAQGTAFGTAGHVIATAKAMELGPLVGATSSLSLVVAGLLTAAVLPVLANFI